LIAHFGSPEAVLQANPREIAELSGLGIKTAEAFNSIDRNETNSQWQKLQDTGAQCLTFWDEDYPVHLKEIYDPPLILFYQGDLQVLQTPCIAIVGTRSPSEYGLTHTKSIAGGLAQQGITVISGMARGIDSSAHKGALEVGGRTVAVFGCGLDITYPSENKKLREKIVDQGAVISEFLFGISPDGKNFPRRNRVISGLSLGTLVVEAGEKSGALITAAYAIDQNREVFALPGDVHRMQSRGCNHLIKTGRAMLISSEMDILEALRVQTSLKFEMEKIPEPELSPEQRKIYEQLSLEPLYIDDLATAVQMNSSEVLTILLQLEMEGVIKQVPGKRFVRI
jgi:DNA processing protein